MGMAESPHRAVGPTDRCTEAGEPRTGLRPGGQWRHGASSSSPGVLGPGARASVLLVNPSSLTALAVALVAFAAGACNAAGPNAPGSSPGPRDSSPDTAPPLPTEVTMESTFRLTSSAFRDGEPIPAEYTCDGDDVSPPLAWSGAPPGTAALVLVVDDPDARGFVHWVVLDIAGAADGALPRGVSRTPGAPQEGRNDFGRIGWGGPCPPSGRHRYVFTLFALSEPLGLPGTPDAATVRRAMDGRVLGTARLTGTYRRGG